MSIVVLLAALVHFGCQTPSEQPPPIPAPPTSRSDVLSELLLKNLETAGTLREDHDAAKKFLDSADPKLLARFQIPPVSYLISGYDRAYRSTRNVWSSGSVTKGPYSPPIYLSKYMLFCRFLHNAAHVDAECQYKLIRDANGVMLDIGFNNRPKDFGKFGPPKGFGKYSVVRRLCILMQITRDCPSYALEASLAIDGVRMDRPISSQFKPVMNMILDEVFREIGNLWNSCPQKQNMYKQYVMQVIETARAVILPPSSTALCADDLVETTLVKLNEIDLQFRDKMEC